MHSSHGSRPDGSRCIAPPRASIPESADSVAHLSRRHKGKVAKKSGGATAPPPSHTVQSPMSKVLHPLSFVLCPLSSRSGYPLSSVLCPLSSRPGYPLSCVRCPLSSSRFRTEDKRHRTKAFRTEDKRQRTKMVGPARRAGRTPPQPLATSH